MVDNKFSTMVKELIQYRELLYRLAWRDVRVRYKQSLIGIGWAIFVPFVQMVIFTFVFQRVVKVDTGGILYPIFSYVGLVPWTLFAASIKASTESLVTNRNLVTKIYFPREMFVFSKTLTNLLDFAIAFLIVFGLMVYYHIAFRFTLLLVPAILLVQLAFMTGLGFILAIGNLFYRDVGYIMTVALQIWMFATSVLYPVKVSNPRLQMLLNLNPMTPIINAYRDVVIHGAVPDVVAMLPAIVTALVLFGAGWVIFHRSEFCFAENI